MFCSLVFNQVGFNCSDMNELYNDVTVDISSNRICESECHTHCNNFHKYSQCNKIVKIWQE